MSSKQTDHDLLITINEQVKQINKKLEDFCAKYSIHETRLDAVEKEQLTMTTKLTTIAGVGTMLGAAIVFIANRIWEFLLQKKVI